MRQQPKSCYATPCAQHKPGKARQSGSSIHDTPPPVSLPKVMTVCTTKVCCDGGLGATPSTLQLPLLYTTPQFTGLQPALFLISPLSRSKKDFIIFFKKTQTKTIASKMPDETQGVLGSDQLFLAPSSHCGPKTAQIFLSESMLSPVPKHTPGSKTMAISKQYLYLFLNLPLARKSM